MSLQKLIYLDTIHFTDPIPIIGDTSPLVDTIKLI